MSLSSQEHRSDTTNALLVRAHANDADALERICVRYRERLAALAKTYLVTCPFPFVSGDDAIQSALMSFHDRFQKREYPGLHDRASLWNLLATITRRKVLQAVRREQRLKRGGGQVVSLDGRVPQSDEELGGYEPESREPDPAEEALARDLLDRLFEKLNETNRQVIWLRLAGYTNHEIAAQLDRTEKAVERRLDTIREELRQLGDVD